MVGILNDILLYAVPVITHVQSKSPIFLAQLWHTSLWKLLHWKDMSKINFDCNIFLFIDSFITDRKRAYGSTFIENIMQLTFLVSVFKHIFVLTLESRSILKKLGGVLFLISLPNHYRINKELQSISMPTDVADMAVRHSS